MIKLLPYLRATLYEARLAAGDDATQIAVGLAEGVTSPAISKFESGTAKWPLDPDARVEAYAKVCGVEPEELWREVFRRYDAAAASRTSKRRRQSA